MLVKSLVKGLKVLTAEAERMEKVVVKLEKKQATKPKAKAKTRAKAKRKTAKKAPAAKRSAKRTDQDRVLAAIGIGKKGVTTAQIKRSTGFGDRKVWSVINRLKKQGKVKSAGRGVYAKA
jgi:hypothetical protein